MEIKTDRHHRIHVSRRLARHDITVTEYRGQQSPDAPKVRLTLTLDEAVRLADALIDQVERPVTTVLDALAELLASDICSSRASISASSNWSSDTPSAMA